ncbi:MAG: hypothetical protein M3R68_10615 [Acidobacteriota bacterium]|nr:hypothetical protein [Acidobacteriota bacterium]
MVQFQSKAWSLCGLTGNALAVEGKLGHQDAKKRMTGLLKETYYVSDAIPAQPIKQNLYIHFPVLTSQ